MWNSEIIFSFFVATVAVAYTDAYVTTNLNTVVSTHYEETRSYSQNPQCKPSSLNKGIRCCDVGPSIEIQGELYDNFDLFFVRLASPYYIARFADAWGYQNRCPANTAFLKKLDMKAPWTGPQAATAMDCACDFKDIVREKCTFPDADNPFLCTGIDGTPGTFGKRLGTLSYTTILQGANLRWTLFVHCWDPRTKQNPHAEETATSFNVFSLDPELTVADRDLVIQELTARGFNTSSTNLIEFNYTTTTDCS